MALFFIAGIVVSAWLGIRGLARGEIDLTYETTLTGNHARIGSILCLSFSLLMVLLTVWALIAAPVD